MKKVLIKFKITEQAKNVQEEQMEVLSGNVVLGHAKSPRISTAVPDFKSHVPTFKRRPATMDLEICGNLTFSNSGNKKKEQLNQQEEQQTTEEKPKQRRTSQFSSAVEIYQNKMNYKHNKLFTLENEASVEATLSDDSTGTNSRVNILRTEIARLREEILLKINALENEMSGQIEVQFELNDKATQTDDILPTTKNIPEGIPQSNISTSTSNVSCLLQSIMSQMDEKLDSMKVDIFEKFDQIIASGKLLPLETSKQPSGNTTSVSILAPDSSQMDVPDAVPSTPENMQHERDLNCVRNHTRNLHSGNDVRLHEPPTYTRAYFTNRRSSSDIRQPFASYENKNPMLYPYPSSRSQDNHSPIIDIDKSIHEVNNSSYVIFDQYSQTAREELARHLVDQLFPYDDLADANVRGVKGKRLLDPAKIQQIRENIFRTYPVRSTENEDYLWKFICDKINAKCRGVTRTLKRKTNDYSYRFSDYQFTNQTSLNLSDYHKHRKDRYQYDRCSFVTAVDEPLNGLDQQQHRTLSSSDSESSSAECYGYQQSAHRRFNKDNSDVMEEHQTTYPGNLSNCNDYKHPYESMVEQHDGHVKREEESHIKVTDEDDDVISDDGGSLGPARDLDKDATNLSLANDVEASLEICDKLAEKYTDHYPNVQGQDSFTDRKRIQGNREEFTRTLIEAMFTRSTLAHSNVTGARGKFMLDPVKIAKVRETVFKKFPAENEDEQEVLWKVLTTKINTKCRGVKRLMKRKGLPAECVTKRHQTNERYQTDGRHQTDEDNYKQKVVVVKNESPSYPAAIYD